MKNNSYKTRPLSPQTRLVLEHLITTGEITGRDALMNLGIANASLNFQIKVLRDHGFKITTKMRRNPVTNQKYGAFIFDRDARASA